MSVIIYWRPVGDRGKPFSNGTSDSLEKLKQTFGPQIHTDDVGRLRAMQIATDDAFYGEVADIVENVGSITFWGVW